MGEYDNTEEEISRPADNIMWQASDMWHYLLLLNKVIIAYSWLLLLTLVLVNSHAWNFHQYIILFTHMYQIKHFFGDSKLDYPDLAEQCTDSMHVWDLLCWSKFQSKDYMAFWFSSSNQLRCYHVTWKHEVTREVATWKEPVNWGMLLHLNYVCCTYNVCHIMLFIGDHFGIVMYAQSDEWVWNWQATSMVSKS